MIEFDLNRALFLTYTGVGAAFLVLGTLVVFTALIGRWGDWRLRRAQARAEEAHVAATLQVDEAPAEPEQDSMNTELVAAIGAAIAMAAEAYHQEQVENLAGAGDTAINASGWREQGRIAAIEGRRLRERDR